MKLGITMVHKLGHSTINFNPNLNQFLQVKTTNGYEPELLFPGAQGDLGKTTIEHGIIWGIERDLLKLNRFKDLYLSIKITHINIVITYMSLSFIKSKAPGFLPELSLIIKN
ncbi:hypothetical protein J2810_003689 [Chryseobacterium rhizosphaerae]|uniref:hypothetical protein n=1 Tax=Chryseobacterium rhizosphaerae TaxID=395937 RepID=UPI000647381C|nr:hypothetical protein [Chryseobacterium rhizosphaerae]MDR6547604.1 hypothetical protein [Chryseobacterium rhizosphaerae]